MKLTYSQDLITQGMEKTVEQPQYMTSFENKIQGYIYYAKFPSKEEPVPCREGETTFKYCVQLGALQYEGNRGRLERSPKLTYHPQTSLRDRSTSRMRKG